MPIAADYPFLEVVGTMLIFFAWVAWFWMVITVFADLFRRHDIGGWGKAGWAALIILLPILGTLIYLIGQGKSMAERNIEDAQSRKAQFDEYVRSVSAANGGGGGGGATSEIARAKELLDSGAIDQAEFEELKRKALA